MNNIIICEAEYSGFCTGVKAAVKKINYEVDHNEQNKKIYLMGKLIHNDVFIRELQSKGVILIGDEIISPLEDIEDKFILKTELEKVIEEESTVIIRAHGINRNISEALELLNIKIVDTTCGCIKKIHQIARENTAEDSLLFIIGDENHPEVRGIKSCARGNVIVADTVEKIKNGVYEGYKKVVKHNAIVLLSQTTHSRKVFDEAKEYLSGVFKNIKIFDTICNTTENRQNEVEKLSKTVDVMIVVGGLNSSNTRKLFEIAKNNCENTFIIETSEQMPLYIFEEIMRKNHYPARGANAVKVGIVAGASTPDMLIKEVKQIMTEMTDPKNQIAGESELSFEELLNQSFVTLNRGEKVKGVVTTVLPGELHIDLGIKQTGILAFDEITDDSSFKLEENFKPGDEIEVQILKISDQDGTAMLSKKRIDASKGWENILRYHSEGTVAEGKVISVVNRGVIALIEGVKVFIPEYQTNLQQGAGLETLVGKNIKVKILNVDELKHRVIASAKQVANEERRVLSEKLWETIAAGNRYAGTVKSLTSYGAFVDIGGADGMVHRSELSWERIKHPSDVLKVGDKIEVYIKEIIDDEKTGKRKISLGYKDENANPWHKFLETYKVGDVADVKIMSFTAFGAFAEVQPGVDGLIHISQISDKKVAKPSDELTIGKTYKAKITAIDEEKKKISLSIRELLESNSDGNEEAEADETKPLENVEEASE